MRILFFLFFSLSTLAQDLNYVNPRATVPGLSNIQDITITVNAAQYLGTDVSISANPNGANVTSWKWRILYNQANPSGGFDTLLQRTSTSQNPTFSLDSAGFYDVKLTASNSSDKYEVYESRLFIVQPARFTKLEADVVINMSAGSGGKFLDYRGVDMSDKKIWIEGQTTTQYLELVSLQGTRKHPVRIQKANDNTQVTIQSTGGSGHPLFFSQYDTLTGQGARYVVVNGFNLDGTPGIKVTTGTFSTVTVRVEGKLTDIAFYGIEVQSNPLTIDGAAIAVVPTVSSTCSKLTWGCNNIHVYRCLLNAGEEGVYINESNQSTGYVGNNGKNPPSGIGIVVARNTITAAGRDGIQVGSAGADIDDNLISNFGQQHDPGGQESGIVANSGFFGRIRRNKIVNGEMFLNMASGEYAYAPKAGQSTPQPTLVEGNIFSSGTYGAGGTDETHAIYIQNNPVSGAGNWNLTFRNNIIDTDNKCAEMLLALGGYTSQNLTFANNICIKVGNAGDTQEFNVTGNGKASLQGGTKIVNNSVTDQSNTAAIALYYFNNYAAHDFNITNLSSTAYSGSPSTLSASYDYYRFPIPVPSVGYFFGVQGNYNKRIITP